MTDFTAVAQGMYDDVSAGSDVVAAIDKYMADDFVEHGAVPGMGATRDTPRQMFKMMHAAFPDFRIDVLEMLQDGDKVVTRLKMLGTHEGEFMGVPASANRIEVDSIDIMQFRGDKCIAHWGVMDTGAMMQQIAAGTPE